MSRSLHTGVAKRRPKNRMAAERATASLAGTPLDVPEPDPSRFDVIPVESLPKVRRKPGQPKLPALVRNGAVLRLPGKEVLTQRPYLPPAAQPGVTALQAFLQTRTHGITEGMAELVTAGDYAADDSHDIQWNMTEPLLSRHHRRRVAQHLNWETAILSVQTYRIYLAHKHGGTFETEHGPNASMTTCTCSRKKHIGITLIELSGPTSSTLEICGCTSAAERLLPRGYFPCAPRRPSLAFSTSLLDLISIHSLQVSPNTTAWARTLESFWARRGPVKRATGSLRKRLGMALTWYQVLDNRAEDFVTQCLPESTVRKRPRETSQEDSCTDMSEPRRKRARLAEAGVVDSSAVDSTAAVDEKDDSEWHSRHAESEPAQPGPDIPGNPKIPSRSRTSGEMRAGSYESAPEGARPAVRPSLQQKFVDGRLSDASSSASSTEGLGGPDASASPCAESKTHNTCPTKGKKDQASSKPAKSRAGGADEHGTKPEDIQRPSPRLQRICPLCFGGDRPSLQHSKSHVLVCLDANFAQKRRKSSQTDSTLSYAGGRFAEQSVISAMEAEVAGKRKGPPRKRRRGPEDGVSDDVLDECERSFIAAQESVTKASKNYYADTGLMALLCRHDRVLLLANLTTPGERQHYALALLRKLAQELPKTWHIGVLYDIACQVSRSIAKWGLVPELDGRLSFAVSVFHAYGHQWECQIVFHPRKRDGFGLTDGEGCERFWSSIRHLIAALRVSGFHRRLVVLDRQVHSLDHDGMWNLALWLRKRYKTAQQRLTDAQSILDACGETEDELGAQWKAQVAAQLEKHRQSKSSADKVIDKKLEGISTIDGLRQDVQDDRKRLRKARKLSATEAHAISIRIDDTRREIESLQHKIDTMQASLGTEQCRRLESMRGNEYLSARVNARALRANIRQALVAHKFEHRKLERAYRHQLMQAKEHTQTKDLIHRRERNISSQVAKFNKLVDRMVILARDGYKPRGRVVMPRKLDTKKLFKLDIDDEIWQEDPGLGPQNEGELPRYIADPNVQRGMTALLEKRRCVEEVERLQAEVVALRRWWDEQEELLRSVCEDTTDESSLRLAVRRRYDLHRALRTEFARELAFCALGEEFRPIAGDPSPCPPASSGPSVRSGNETEDSTLVDDASDDASDAYSDCDDEDEPEADWLDALERTPGLERGVDDSDEDVMPHSDIDEGDGDSSPEYAGEQGDPTDAGIVSPSLATFSTSTKATFAPSASATSSAAPTSAATTASRKKKRPRPQHRVLYVAGNYKCLDHDLERMSQRHAWLSGDGLSTFVESERLKLGVTDAGIVHSCTLFDVKTLTYNRKRGETEAAACNSKDIMSALQKLVDPRDARKWLILGHVEDPPHWTLIEVLWVERKIRFYDSRSRIGGYASELERKTRLLLKIWEDHVTQDLDVETFTWVDEQRPLRQFNGYDCGPFVAADAVSLLTSDSPSALTQDDMAQWRQTMETRVRALRVVEEIDYTKRKAENTVSNVIEIDD